MKTHQLLKRAILDGQSDDAGKKFGVGGDAVRRWRREPESDDAPLSTGRANPLDRVEDLIDFVLLNNPSMARSVAEHPLEYYKAKAETLALKGTIKSAAARALDDMVQAVNAISLDAPVDEVEAKIEAANAQLAELKRHVRVTYAGKAANGNGGRPVYGARAHMDNLGD